MIIQVPEPVLEVHDLTVSYNRKPVLWDIHLTVPGGVLAGIIGPNGAGKSTLIKAIMGLVPLSSGYSRIFGLELDKVRKRISYVPQRESVDWDFPASVLDVVLMGRYARLGLFSRPGKLDREIAMSSLEQVSMAPYADRQISRLSGGQQQRVFLARALAQQADIYFMDEPFAGVDVATEAAIMLLLQEMRAAGKTVIVVHHDLQTAPDYFDWTILLNMRLVASGPTAQVFSKELLQETYGGKLTILTKIQDLLQKQQFPLRESN